MPKYISILLVTGPVCCPVWVSSSMHCRLCQRNWANHGGQKRAKYTVAELIKLCGEYLTYMR